MSFKTISQILPGVRTGTIVARILYVSPPKQVITLIGGCDGIRWVTNAEAFDYDRVLIGVAFWFNSQEAAEELKMLIGCVYLFGGMNVRTLVGYEKKFGIHDTLGLSATKYSEVRLLTDGVQGFPLWPSVRTISLNKLFDEFVGVVVAVVAGVGKPIEDAGRPDLGTVKRLITLATDTCKYKVIVAIWGEATKKEPTVGEVIGIDIRGSFPTFFTFSTWGAEEMVYCKAQDLDVPTLVRLGKWFATVNLEDIPVWQAPPVETLRVVAFNTLIEGGLTFEFHMRYRTCAPLYELCDRPLDFLCLKCGGKLYGKRCYECYGDIEGVAGYYFNFSLGTANSHCAFRAKGSVGDQLYGMCAEAYSTSIGTDSRKFGILASDLLGRLVQVTFEARTGDRIVYVYNALEIQFVQGPSGSETDSLSLNRSQPSSILQLDTQSAHGPCATCVGHHRTHHCTGQWCGRGKAEDCTNHCTVDLCARCKVKHHVDQGNAEPCVRSGGDERIDHCAKDNLLASCSISAQDGVRTCLVLHKKAHSAAAKQMFHTRVTRYLMDSLDELDAVWLLEHLVDFDLSARLFGCILDCALAKMPTPDHMGYLVSMSNHYQSAPHLKLLSARIKQHVSTKLQTGTPPPKSTAGFAQASSPSSPRRVRQKLHHKDKLPECDTN